MTLKGHYLLRTLLCQSCSIVVKWYVVGVGDSAVGYEDEELLKTVNIDDVSICSGSAAILNASLLPARAPNYRIVSWR